MADGELSIGPLLGIALVRSTGRTG